MRVEIVPCLLDNYAYLAIDEASREALIVDPCEARPIEQAISAAGVEPIAILCTHHHSDHVGGLEELLARRPGIRVIAHPKDEKRIRGVTEVAQHQELSLLGNLSVLALHVPGHTLGAIAWVVDGCAFTGDTLFSAGCGRLFEGTAPMMYASLNDTLLALPDTTRVYCGHEYTTANLRFALTIEPGNQVIRRKLEEVLIERFGGKPTVPSTLGQEREINPFLRCTAPEVMRAAEAAGVDASTPADIFAWLRKRKDSFRPSQVGRSKV